jgi:predicted dehydrogenase
VTKVFNVAIIGLGFGTQFIPIYQRHPNTRMYAICRRSKESLDAIGDAFGVEKRYTCFEDVLSDSTVDFVHINTPLGTHGALSIAALKAGKHVMCTVPMALSVDECGEIVRLVRSTGHKYMMAETVLYSREYLFIRQLYKQGKLGDLQFLQGSHHQDMDGWPDGWPGLPPMYYATHCVSPCLAIADAEAEYVSCVGSGRIGSELERRPIGLNRSGDSRIGFDLIQASAGLEAGRDGRGAFDGSSGACVEGDRRGRVGPERWAALWGKRAERQPVAGA